MITCTFLGSDRLIDDDLPARISDALVELLSKDTVFEFLFYGWMGFISLAWDTVRMVKKGYPDLSIVTTYVNIQNTNTEILLTPGFDKIIAPLKPHDDNLIQNKRAIRWCIHHSNYLITYFYDFLDDPNLRILQPAKKRKDLTIIDITSNETRAKLLNAMKNLDDREREILNRYYQGEMATDIARAYGITVSAISQIHMRASRKLFKLYGGVLTTRRIHAKHGVSPGRHY